MTAHGHISRILVFCTLIVALGLGANAMIFATTGPASIATAQPDDHGGCC